VTQAAHFAHILLAAQCVDDRARAQEEQGFEIGVSYQMQHPGAVVLRPLGHKHVAKLADGRIGQDALNIKLHNGDGGREDGGQAAQYGNDQQRGR
jgi:hypothetical protein